jgi:putative ABC transport system substrate-binding protein
MRRRELTALLFGAVAARALAASAQTPGIPVVGLLSSGSPDSNELLMTAFRKGLAESWYIEDKNVAIEFRWAGGHHERFPALAADLVSRQVAVIVAASLNAAVAAKRATSTIPIIFLIGDDPIKHGLAAAFNRPSGNATGVDFLVADLVAKRLDLLRELVPVAALMVLLVNPDNPNVEAQAAETAEASRIVGLQVEIVKAATEQEIAAAFASLGSRGAQALVVARTHSSSAFVLKSYRWPPVIEFQRSMSCVRSSRPVGWRAMALISPTPIDSSVSTPARCWQAPAQAIFLSCSRPSSSW